jgi:hypothetical protein
VASNDVIKGLERDYYARLIHGVEILIGAERRPPLRRNTAHMELRLLDLALVTKTPETQVAEDVYGEPRSGCERQLAKTTLQIPRLGRPTMTPTAYVRYLFVPIYTPSSRFRSSRPNLTYNGF